jgi:polyphosphate kinase 2
MAKKNKEKDEKNGQETEAEGIREGTAQAAGRVVQPAGLGQAQGPARDHRVRRSRRRGQGRHDQAITERVSPRVFRLVALPAPSDREKSQMYMQRYIPHFPAAGEIVIFDRSWYNRAGVEYVMGFCTKEQHRNFLERCPEFEHYVTEGGIILLKIWLEVSDEVQKERFEARMDDPLRQWKLSPMDLPSRSKWYEYSHARDMMMDATDTKHAPWYVLRSDDKKRARLNCIRHILDQIPYKTVPTEKVELPERSKKHEYDDQKPLKKRKFIREVY